MVHYTLKNQIVKKIMVLWIVTPFGLAMTQLAHGLAIAKSRNVTQPRHCEEP